MATIGVDLGGSHVLAALVDDAGRIIERAEREIVDHAPDITIETIG
jgi:predicted NBD/HSP70 family sugar kinase